MTLKMRPVLPAYASRTRLPTTIIANILPAYLVSACL